MAITGVSQPLGPIQGGPPSIAAFDTVNPIKTTAYMHSPTPVAGTSAQLHMGMCIPDKTSKATYNILTDKISLNWSKSANTQSHNALMNTAQKMAVASGGTVSNDPGSVADLSLLGTWHPLGGAAMGIACSNYGELYGTPNVFVVDGAAIPGSSGAANPSLTIGANAERIMDYLLTQIS
jgi:cholesterol oxidase